ncbi:regulator of Vps4 activity in the MVB pathway-domain-containing protein [Cladochytrium replicatum]|nr:regulator of Vps4 activity in the MVB pathway-domain-containing protein [Cladochytrium replicatum]
MLQGCETIGYCGAMCGSIEDDSADERLLTLPELDARSWYERLVESVVVSVVVIVMRWSAGLVWLEVQLKLAITRIKTLQTKKKATASVQRREIAQLLEQGREESARIRVEHIIREDFNMEAMEILELYCELLLARFGLLEQMKHCDQAIAEAVNTVIYAAPRSEVKELNMVRDQLILKFGKEFAMAAMENKNDVVNPRIVHKLRVQTPDPILVKQYLLEIARAFNVTWDGGADDELAVLDDTADVSLGISSIGMPGPGAAFAIPELLSSDEADAVHGAPQPAPKSNMADLLDLKTTAAAPAQNVQAKDDVPPSDVSSVPDFDELARRFEALKRRK